MKLSPVLRYRLGRVADGAGVAIHSGNQRCSPSLEPVLAALPGTPSRTATGNSSVRDHESCCTERVSEAEFRAGGSFGTTRSLVPASVYRVGFEACAVPRSPPPGLCAVEVFRTAADQPTGPCRHRSYRNALGRNDIGTTSGPERIPARSSRREDPLPYLPAARARCSGYRAPTKAAAGAAASIRARSAALSSMSTAATFCSR